MLLDRIDEFLNSPIKKILKEDIDTVVITDAVIELVNTLDDGLLNDRQIELKYLILDTIDAADEPVPEEIDPIEDEDSLDDPDTTEPFELPADEYYEDQTIWKKGLSEGKKKSSGKQVKKTVKKQEKNINKGSGKKK